MKTQPTYRKPLKETIMVTLLAGAVIIMSTIITLVSRILYEIISKQQYTPTTFQTGFFLVFYTTILLLITTIGLLFWQHHCTKLTTVSTLVPTTLKNYGLNKRIPIKDYIRYSLMTLIIAIILEALNILVFAEKPITEWQQQLIAANENSPLQIVLLFIATVILAPLWEELIFRGLLFTSWAKLLPAPVTITLTALSWALLHYQQYNNLILATIFIIGMLLGIAKHYSNSTKLPIIMHITNNLFAFCYMYIYSSI